METTNDIDANGYWTIDNFEALTGLATYRWLAEQVGNAAQAKWAAAEYASLLAATNKTLNATISANHLNYLPCSMIEPNTANRCSNAEDANWAAYGANAHHLAEAIFKATARALRQAVEPDPRATGVPSSKGTI